MDCADTRRLGDCKAEFEKLLQQERLAGSSLLVLANKQVRRAHSTTRAAEESVRGLYVSSTNDFVFKRAACVTAGQDLPGALSGEEVKAALRLDCIQDRHWKIQVMPAVRAAAASAAAASAAP